MTVWAIGLLNDFRLEGDDEVVARLRSRYWERLLALVAVNVDRPVTRREIAAVLWPTSSWDRGRNRVSRELGTLRIQLERVGLPPNTLLISHTAIRLRPDFDTDVRRFERLVDQGTSEADIATRLQLLTSARNLYGRGLLPILDGEWLAPERRRLAAVHSRAITCLLETARHTAGIGLASGSVPANASVALTDSDERHIAAMASLAIRASEMLRTVDQNEWLGKIDLHLGGIALALEKAIASGDRQSAMTIAGGLWLYWFERGRIDEGRHYVETALAIDGAKRTRAEAIALNASGALAISVGNYCLAGQRFEEAASVCRVLGDLDGEARAVGNLGNVALHQGRHAESRQLYLEAIRMARDLSRPGAASGFLRGLAVVETKAGNLDTADEYLRERLALARHTGDVSAEAQSLAQMASVAESREDWPRSIELAEQAGELFRYSHNLLGMGFVLRLLGYAKRKQRRIGEAREHLESALSLSRAIGNLSAVGDSLHQRGKLEASEGNYEAAVQWGSSAVETLRDAGYAVHTDEAESDLRLWRAQLGDQPEASSVAGTD